MHWPQYKSFQLDCNEVTIGRSKENSFVIKNDRISRKHAIFRLNNGQWIIESVGMNCVFVNNIKTKKNHQLPLQHMDTIKFTADNQFVYAFKIESYS
jgi:pSer/pThr/pTyr-binding forkhead associated (FHA) protein